MITIHEINPADRESLIGLCQAQENFTSQEIEVAIEVIDDALDPAKNDYQILTARTAQGEVVGFICYGPIPLTEKRFDLYWIAVEPGHGRQGIGKALLAEMEQRLRVHGPALIYVDTSSTPGYDAARGFYEKNGYTVAATLTDFYRTGDDKVIYVKAL